MTTVTTTTTAKAVLGMAATAADVTMLTPTATDAYALMANLRRLLQTRTAAARSAQRAAPSLNGPVMGFATISTSELCLYVSGGRGRRRFAHTRVWTNVLKSGG